MAHRDPRRPAPAHELTGRLLVAVVDAGVQRLDALEHLGEALQQDQRRAHRDHGLVPVRGRPPGRHQRFPEVPRLGGEVPAHPGEHDHARQEEQHVLRDVHARLRLERPVLREEVGADVLLQVQRPGGGKEEVRAVAHGGDVVGPDRRLPELAHHDLVEQHQEHRHDQPGSCLAGPDADAVDDRRDAIDPRDVTTQAGLPAPMKFLPRTPPIASVTMRCESSAATP